MKTIPASVLANAETLFRASEILEEAGDVRSAFRCVAVGAGMNHAFSQTKLADMYASGAGTKKDLKAAAYWYVKAYRNGDRLAAFNLAIDKRDQGDRRAAIAWFRKAAAQDYGRAFVELAKLYKERSAGKRQVMELLKQALECEISVELREEVEALLREEEASG